MDDNPSTLKPRHETFCQRYALHGNQSLAARESGFADRSSGWRLLRKPAIAARVESLQQSALADAGISSARVVNELARLGFANMADYVDRRGNFTVNRLTRDQAAAVVEFTETTSATGVVTRRIKLADKLTALDKLGKHLGVFEADNLQQQASADVVNPRDLARRMAFMLRDAANNGPIAAKPVLTVAADPDPTA
jgi:phage terminase small subunit